MVLQAVNYSTMVGGSVQLMVVITNPGSQATNVVIWDTVPPNTTFPAGDPGNSGWTLSGNVFSYDVGNLPPGANETIYFTLQTSSSLVTGDTITVGGLTGSYHDVAFNQNRNFACGPVTIGVGNIVVYPNPFNPNTAYNHVLKFANLPSGAQVLIYTVSGEEVKSYKENNSYVYWDGKNAYNYDVSAGIYYFEISWDNDKDTYLGKIFLVRQ
jgi:uncharacterized repeat protein (TIGR01451 family)